MKNQINFRSTLAICFISIIIVLFAAVWSLAASEKPTGALVGTVTDATTDLPLVGANITVVNTLIGTSTDMNGRFQLPRVPVGKQLLKVSFIGYRAERVGVEVLQDESTHINFALSPSAILFDQVVITGSRQSEELSEAANSVNVLSNLEIRQRNRFRLDEALEALPAVQRVGENISIRGGTGYSLLGVGGSRVLMMIDDVPVLTSDLGRANWDLLPVTEVERVEVLKGAGSVLYGSGGTSGVVNIITMRPTEAPVFKFRHSAGVYSNPSVPEWKWTDENLYFYRSDMSYSGTIGRVGLRLSASRHYSTGDRQNGDFSRWYFTARPVIRFDDGSNLAIFAAYSRDERGFFLQWQDQNHALNTNFQDRIDVDGFFISATYNKLYSTRFALKSRLSFNSQLIGLPFNLTRDFKPALGFSGEMQGSWLPNDRHTLTFGIDAKRDLAESSYFGEHRGSAVSPYLQEKWKVNEQLQLSAGVRYEAYYLVGDSAETQFSPKVGLSFKPFEGTIIHSSLGRGFRAPTIAERFSVTDPSDNVQLVNNPTLLPERSTLFDIGIRQRIGEFLSAEVTAFSNSYTDLIEIAQISDLTIELQFRNYPRARIEGIETEAKMQLFNNRLGVQGNATWMRSRSLESDRLFDLDVDTPLPYRPRFSAYVSPFVKFGNLTFEAEYRYTSRFERVSFFPRDERVPLKVLDLRARYQWKRYSFLFQVNNAVNYNYTVIEQNLGELRNFSIAISGEL